MSDYLHKKNFIEAQLRLINQPFQPPEAWRSEDEDEALPEDILDTVLQQVNAELRKRRNLSFSHQSIRQVLEQVHHVQVIGEDPLDNMLMNHEDLLTTNWLDSFPNEWLANTNDNADITRYNQLRLRVHNHLVTYQSLRAKHSYFKNFSNLASQLDISTIGKNSLIRDSPIKKELERTMLLLRQLKETLGTHKDLLLEKRKLASFSHNEIFNKRAKTEISAKSIDVVFDLLKSTDVSE